MSDDQKRGRGRPPGTGKPLATRGAHQRPREDAGVVTPIRFAPHLRGRMEAAAAAEGLPLSAWVRQACERALDAEA